MDLELRGRVALVTGASRGLGRAIALRLAEEGCALAVCARDGEGLATAVSELEARGVPVFATALDVTDAPALEAFVADAAERLGALELVVANAGGAAGGPRLEDTTAEDWATSFALNPGHCATLTRAALPHLRARGGGAVLFIGSVSGSRPQPRPQYGAAKAAEAYLAAALARELGPEAIRVNVLSPGSILFPGGSWDRRRTQQPEAFAAFVEEEFPRGRLGTAEEIADVAAFLLSPRASWVSGTEVVVDGAQNQPSMTGY